jgi:hypothetical protein
MVNTINKLLDLPVSRKLEDLYTSEIHEPKIEELEKEFGTYEGKRKKLDS